LACVLVLLVLASSAQAAGIALRWGSCEGTSNRNFACDRSTGSELLVGSFDPPGGINQLIGIQAYIRFSAADASLPAWWQVYAAGNCRRGGIVASLDLSDQVECDDTWSGQAVGGSGLYPKMGPNDVYVIAALPPAMALSVQSGRTYGAFKLIINHQKSSGAGACSGCSTPMCITFESFRLVQPGRLLHPSDPGDNSREEKYAEITSAIGGLSQVATWQGGTSNCGAGLAKPATWSTLKSMFKPK
jgi:hypothetical protein